MSEDPEFDRLQRHLMDAMEAMRSYAMQGTAIMPPGPEGVVAISRLQELKREVDAAYQAMVEHPSPNPVGLGFTS